MNEPMTKNIEEVREFFAKDNFAKFTGAVIEEIGDKYCRCSMKIEDRHLNALGAVQGGVMFTLADFTFAVASNWQKHGTVTLASSISYYSPVKGTSLICEAKCVKDGHTACFYDVVMTDDLGTKVASVAVNGYKVSK